MNVQVIAPGSCGELVQGTIDGQSFLVTCPVDLYSQVTVSLERGRMAADPKTLAAVKRTQEYLGRTADHLSVSVQSDLPIGKGMASSSADISAACLATALCLGRELTTDEIADLALAIEPTDGIFFDGIVMIDHVAGRIRRFLGPAPDIHLAVFDVGGEVDTLHFNRRSDLAALNRAKEPQVRLALDLVIRGIAQGDAALVGEGATLSARANQSILFKPCLETVVAIAQEYGAVGVAAAHSGTVLGLMFAGERREGMTECVTAITARCREIVYLQNVRLISGGLMVKEAKQVTEPVSFEHGGNVYAQARQMGQSLDAVLDFSANINPLGLAASVRRSLEINLDNLIHYPDPSATELKQAIGRYYQVATRGITVGNGAVELLYVLCHRRQPRRVLVTAPTFSEYERAARAAGAAVEYFMLPRERDFTVDVEEICQRLAGMDMVFICNPNNPTGALLSRAQLEPLVIAARQTKTLVIIDESFLDFLPDDREITCRPLLTSHENLLIVHSLTKFYAVPGLRLGFVLTSAEQTRELHLAKDPWNVNSLAQAVGVVALNDRDYQERGREVVARAGKKLFAQLGQIAGCHPFPPSVNYILVNIAATGIPSTELRQRLATMGLLIRDCANYPGLSKEYIRVAVKLPEQNERLVMALQQALLSRF